MSRPDLPPPQEISAQDLGRLCVMRGWPQAVLICRTDEGDEQVVHMGLTYKDGRIAEEMAKTVKQMMGWKMDSDQQAALDREVATAAREMAEGPVDGDQSIGKKLIGEKLEMRAGEKKIYLPSVKKKDRRK